MKVLIVFLAAMMWGKLLLATQGKENYSKAVELISTYYYKPLDTDQIQRQGVNRFIKTTPLLSEEDKKKIRAKFDYYDQKYTGNMGEGTSKKIETLISVLSAQMFSEAEVYEMLTHASLEALDVHSGYLDKKHFDALKVQSNGEFGGLGVTVGIRDEKLTVISPIDDTPAFHAGLKAGDIISKIDGVASEKMSIDKAVSLMRGKVNTAIELTILRQGKMIPVHIVRDTIKIKSVHTKMLSNEILYIRVTSFDKQVVNKISAAIEENDNADKGIILDLRNNPGGLLDQAVGVLDLFMKAGHFLTQKARKSEDSKRYDASFSNTLTNAPLVVLINEGSASASEIVSGALQANMRAVVFGQRSFGKGTAQAILPFSAEGAVKFTIAEYLLAGEKGIQGRGITPDFSMGTDIVEEKDSALQAAQDYLTDRKLFNKQYVAKAYAPAPQDKRFRNQDISSPKYLPKEVQKSSLAGLSERVDSLQKTAIDKSKWLISIGIEDYEYTEDVKYSKKSAELFTGLLQKKYGIEAYQSLVLMDSDATMGRIRNKMKRFLRQVKKGDTIYFYYNGHGVPVPSQHNEPYMLPSDVEPEFAGDDDFFKMKNILNLLSNSKADKVIAVIDSCFSGGNDGVSLIKGVAATRLVPKKISFDKQKMVVLYAGKGTQYSNMFEQAQHRLFSYYVMDSILKGREDVETLYNEVFVNVKDESFKMGDMHLQEPTLMGNKNLKLK